MRLARREPIGHGLRRFRLTVYHGEGYILEMCRVEKARGRTGTCISVFVLAMSDVGEDGSLCPRLVDCLLVLCLFPSWRTSAQSLQYRRLVGARENSMK